MTKTEMSTQISLGNQILYKLPATKRISDLLVSLKSVKDFKERKKILGKILDKLNKVFKLKKAKLTLIDKKPPIQDGYHICASYIICDGKCEIVIYNRNINDSRRSARSLINSILHEWIHHYDACYLDLKSYDINIHDAGFQSRFRFIRAALMEPES